MQCRKRRPGRRLDPPRPALPPCQAPGLTEQSNPLPYLSAPGPTPLRAAADRGSAPPGRCVARQRERCALLIQSPGSSRTRPTLARGESRAGLTAAPQLPTACGNAADKVNSGLVRVRVRVGWPGGQGGVSPELPFGSSFGSTVPAPTLPRCEQPGQNLRGFLTSRLSTPEQCSRFLPAGSIAQVERSGAGPLPKPKPRSWRFCGRPLCLPGEATRSPVPAYVRLSAYDLGSQWETRREHSNDARRAYDAAGDPRPYPDPDIFTFI